MRQSIARLKADSYPIGRLSSGIKDSRRSCFDTSDQNTGVRSIDVDEKSNALEITRNEESNGDKERLEESSKPRATIVLSL